MDETTQPTAPGFYKYSGGGQIILFKLDADSQWWALFLHGGTERCEWGYIEQALSVWTLELIQ